MTAPGDNAPPPMSAPPAGADPTAIIAWLAMLDLIQYDQRRQEEAETLGIRAATLDALVAKARGGGQSTSGQGRALDLPTPEPWPEPVDGAALLDGMVAAIRRYLVVSGDQAAAMALWAIHCHALDAAQIAPRLAFVSPTKRCGKSTALAISGKLVPRPLPASNITSAALFRAVEAAEPTLLIDEADSFLANSDELRGILNSGHNRATAYVVRTAGDDHEPRRFSTWGAVAIALIGRLPDTLEDRAIVIQMRRRAPGERIERLRLDRMGDFDVLARQAVRWSGDNMARLARADPDVPAALHDRAADNWRALLAIAGAAGGHWPERARASALALSGQAAMEDSGAAVHLLADVCGLFAERGVERLPSGDICDALAKLEARAWPEWKNGKPITPRQLAKMLAPFGIAPASVRTADGTPKGYRLDQFHDAFARYLPLHSATPQQSFKINGLDENLSATQSGMLRIENGENTNENNAVADVADPKGGSARERWEMEH